VNASTIRRVAGPSLVAGGIAFGLFWGSQLVGLEVRQPVALPIHGLTILLITVGLIGMQLSTSTRRAYRTLSWVAVALAVLGLLTFFPVLGIGLALVGVVVIVSGGLLEGAALTLGSLTLVGAYLFGSRLGEEEASDPSAPLVALFAFAIVLVVGGLVASGIRQDRQLVGK
jgi:hypothetical protein